MKYAVQTGSVAVINAHTKFRKDWFWLSKVGGTENL
jgi:hypothetical protein